MILSLLKLTPEAGKSDDIIEILMSVVGPSQAEPGCLRCEVARGTGEELVFLIEEWASHADFHRHIRSDLYLRILSAMEYSSLRPEFTVYQSLEPTGLALVEYLRMHPEEHPDAPRI